MKRGNGDWNKKVEKQVASVRDLLKLPRTEAVRLMQFVGMLSKAGIVSSKALALPGTHRERDCISICTVPAPEAGAEAKAGCAKCGRLEGLRAELLADEDKPHRIAHHRIILVHCAQCRETLAATSQLIQRVIQLKEAHAADT